MNRKPEELALMPECVTDCEATRRPINPREADALLHEIEYELPVDVKPYLDATFVEHDAEAADELVGAAPNHLRGWIALCAYLSGLPNPAYRVIINSVWNHDHDQLVGVSGGRRQVRRMMVAAKFPVPFSGEITIFRGTAKVEAEKAVKGLAWTTSYEVACWFAHRFSFERPLVLKAVVPATEIIYWTDERREKEVILRTAPPLLIDDHPEQWKEIAKKERKRRRAADPCKVAPQVASSNRRPI
jgi:hypothetical protein